MKIGILGAMDVEVALLVKQMQVESKIEAIGTTFYQGTLEGCQVVVAVMSIGKVNAALCTAHMIREFGVDAVINVGIAGAMASGLGVMDVVVSDEVVFHDSEPFMDTFFPYTLRFKADSELKELALEACADVVAAKGRHFICGLIATGDRFIAGAEQRDSINERFAPHCVEMEGASVGHTAFVYDVPFLVIRTMSDSADDKAENTYKNFKEVAADQSAAIVTALARKLAVK